MVQSISLLSSNITLSFFFSVFISCATRYGIRFSDQGTSGVVRGNKVFKNGKAGMLVLLGAQPRVVENNFYDGESCGIVRL